MPVSLSWHITWVRPLCHTGCLACYRTETEIPISTSDRDTPSRLYVHSVPSGITMANLGMGWRGGLTSLQQQHPCFISFLALQLFQFQTPGRLPIHLLTVNVGVPQGLLILQLRSSLMTSFSSLALHSSTDWGSPSSGPQPLTPDLCMQLSSRNHPWDI